jgi:hypothetical protein
LILSHPKYLLELNCMKYFRYYTHYNYLLEDVKKGVRDFSNMYISDVNYNMFYVLTGKRVNINVCKDTSLYDKSIILKIYMKNINVKLLKYILDKEGIKRLFFNFYYKKNIFQHLNIPNHYYI